jgi:hypothetical protein
VKRIRRYAFGTTAALSAILCAISFLPNLSPSPDIRILALLTPGGNVWHALVRYPGLTLARIRYSPNPGLPPLGIGYHDLNPANPAAPAAILPVRIQSLTSSNWWGMQYEFGTPLAQLPSHWELPIIISVNSMAPSLMTQSSSISTLFIPLSTVNTALALLPAAWLILTLRRRLNQKPPEGHCPVCGYDLRATPEKCPECGTVQQPSLSE